MKQRRHLPVALLPAAAAAVVGLAVGQRTRRRGRAGGDRAAPRREEVGAPVPEADLAEQRQPVLQHGLDRPDLDADASERDLVEQGQPVAVEAGPGSPPTDPEVPEADTLEQASSVGDGEDRE